MYGTLRGLNKMKARQNGVVLLILSLFSTTAFSDEAKIVLKSVKIESSQEQSGDELYISVTEFPKKQLPQNYQVPTFPTHWLSQYITNVRDVLIWKKDLKDCNDIDLMLTLVEEDVQPWNADDSLGTLKLKLTCQNGKMHGFWVIPDAGIVSKNANQKDSFVFSGDKSKYDLQFSFENIATP